MTTAQQRKKQERQARRRRIQDAAREVFAQKGYAKTSIEQVARQASLSVGAIYLYFRSKEDLYISLLEETLRNFESDLRQIRTRTDIPAGVKLVQSWKYFTDWAAADLEGSRTLRLISQPKIDKQLSDEVAEYTRNGLNAIREHFSTVIADGTQAGVYHCPNPQSVADVLWSMFLGMLQSADTKANLDLACGAFGDTSEFAIHLLETSLRHPDAALAAEAA